MFAHMAGDHMVNASQNLFYFLTHSSTDQDKIWYGVEAIQVGHPDSTVECDLLNMGNKCCFTDCIKKFNVDMHSNISEPGIMIDTVELYILILVVSDHDLQSR